MQTVSLGELFGERVEPKTLPVEGQIARLRDVQTMVARRWSRPDTKGRGSVARCNFIATPKDDLWRHPYKFGDLLVPRLGGPYANKQTLVMLVVDLIHDAERRWDKTGVDEGARLDTRVAYVVDDRVALLWLESWALQPFKDIAN